MHGYLPSASDYFTKSLFYYCFAMGSLLKTESQLAVNVKS